MTNNYTKLTKETFVERLKAGTYANDVAAKRGLGRAALSKAAKLVCLDAIEKHFNGKKGKASKKKAPAKKAAKKAEGKAAAKAGTKKKTFARRRSPRPGPSAAAPTPVATVEDTSWMSEEMQEKLAQVHLARQQIGTIAQAIGAMKLAKEVHPDLDVTEGSEASQRILTHAVSTLEGTVESASNGARSEPAPNNAPQSAEAPVPIPTEEEIASEIGAS